jgi:hypothetical protein
MGAVELAGKANDYRMIVPDRVVWLVFLQLCSKLKLKDITPLSQELTDITNSST